MAELTYHRHKDTIYGLYYALEKIPYMPEDLYSKEKVNYVQQTIKLEWNGITVSNGADKFCQFLLDRAEKMSVKSGLKKSHLLKETQSILTLNGSILEEAQICTSMNFVAIFNDLSKEGSAKESKLLNGETLIEMA